MLMKVREFARTALSPAARTKFEETAQKIDTGVYFKNG